MRHLGLAIVLAMAGCDQTFLPVSLSFGGYPCDPSEPTENGAVAYSATTDTDTFEEGDAALWTGENCSTATSISAEQAEQPIAIAGVNARGTLCFFESSTRFTVAGDVATLDVPALDSACATNTTCPDHVDAMNPIYQLALELVATSLAFCGSTYAITVANLLLSNAINTAAPSGNHTEGVRGVAARFTLARPSGGVVLSSARPPPFALRLGFPTSGYRLGITFRGTPSLSRPAMIDPPPGEYFAFAQVLKGELPAQDPVNHYQYAFVFDADGDTSNNYTPLAQYPADFFKDTDRWYELLYTPSAGWTTKVSTARGSSIQPAQSDAHLLVVGSVILLLVPVSEFASSTPAYRFTAFRHTGNYGLQPPHDFDGYVDPPVAMGLHTFEP